MFRGLQTMVQLLQRRKALSISARGSLLIHRSTAIIKADMVTNVVILLGKKKSNINLGTPIICLLATLKALS